MNRITLLSLIGLLFMLSCTDQENLPYVPLEEINKGQEVDSHRIRILNESVELNVAQNTGSQASPFNLTDIATESSPSFNCNETISEAFSGNKRVNNRKVVCLDRDVSFNGSIELRGGTFVIKGNATLASINGNKGTIVITETGSLTIANIHLNNNFELINYGNSLNVNTVTLSGDFENHGNISVKSITVNGGAEFKNTGTLTVENNFNVNKEAENEGTVMVRGNLTINGGAKFKNDCKLIVAGNLQNNKSLENKGYVQVGGTLTVNGGASVKFDPQAYLLTNNLTLNGKLEGSSRDYARVDILNTTVINGGGRVEKKLDINDSDGFEVNTGRFDNSVTINQALAIEVTACNPGAVVEPINPEYTLVAEVTVPQLNNTHLSATDVVYHNNLAMVSYHLNGQAFGGAIDLINLANLNQPSFTMNYLSEAKEFNAITTDGESIFMAGQRNVDESGYQDNDTNGALLYSTSLNRNLVFDPIEDWREVPMHSFSCNDIEILDNGNLLFASGASGGGFFKLSAGTLSILERSQNDFSKSVSVSRDTEARLVGGNGEAKLMLIKDGQESEVLLGASAVPVDGKNVVLLKDDFAYVTLGQNGLVVVNINSGTITGRYNPDMPGLTNGVAVDDDFIYLANGQSGLLLIRKDNLEFYAQYKYNGSANLVEVVDDIILIANGTGGVKLLKRTS